MALPTSFNAKLTHILVHKYRKKIVLFPEQLLSLSYHKNKLFVSKDSIQLLLSKMEGAHTMQHFKIPVMIAYVYSGSSIQVMNCYCCD